MAFVRLERLEFAALAALYVGLIGSCEIAEGFSGFQEAGNPPVGVAVRLGFGPGHGCPIGFKCAAGDLTVPDFANFVRQQLVAFEHAPCFVCAPLPFVLDGVLHSVAEDLFLAGLNHGEDAVGEAALPSGGGWIGEDFWHGEDELVFGGLAVYGFDGGFGEVGDQVTLGPEVFGCPGGVDELLDAADAEGEERSALGCWVGHGNELADGAACRVVSLQDYHYFRRRSK